MPSRLVYSTTTSEKSIGTISPQWSQLNLREAFYVIVAFGPHCTVQCKVKGTDGERRTVIAVNDDEGNTEWREAFGDHRYSGVNCAYLSVYEWQGETFGWVRIYPAHPMS